MASTILAKMAVQISANTAEMVKGINGARSELGKLSSSVTDIAKNIGIAFGIKEVLNFTVSVSKLAGEFEAVKIAFDRLKESKQLLEDLKTATNGTVSELDLMKRAVQASNFDISLKALPKLLEFATLRAQQTGQSVDYLVDSIVTGIGRKSKLILDNLGISAVQLNEALGGASTAASSIGEVADAVGRIAEANLKNMAGYADNAKTSFDRMAASWENFKASIGQSINESFLNNIVGDSASIMDVLSNKTLGWTQKVEILATTWSSVGIKEKLDEWSKKIDPILDKQNNLNKFDAQLLINKYGSISNAISGLIEMTRIDAAFSKDANRQLDNRKEILNILYQRQKDFNDSLTRAQQEDSDANQKAKQSADEINKKYKERLELIQQLNRIQEGINAGEQVANQNTGQIFNTKNTTVDLPSKVSSPFKLIPDGLVEETDDRIKQMEEQSRRIESLNRTISNSFAELATSVLKAAGASLVGQGDFGKALLQTLASFGQKFGEQLIALGGGHIALGYAENNSAEIVKGVGLVAAGGALVLASSALAANISAGGASVSSSGGIRADRSINKNYDSSNGYVTNVEFKIKGSDLVASFRAAQSDNRIRRR